MEATVLAKRGYVSAMRAVRAVARPLGALDHPADYRTSRTRHWLQSLLAIYDLDQLIRLDVPWWTYEAIGKVEAFLKARGNARVFEYGSGASTAWLAKRAQRVTSVEHDGQWLELLRPRLAGFGHVTVELAAPDSPTDPDTSFHSHKAGYRGRSFRSYVETIRRCDGPFDLIVIDGRARPACLTEAAGHLAPGGMIVFDNSHRGHYQAALDSCGLHREITRGLVPSLPVPDQTSLLTVRPDAAR